MLAARQRQRAVASLEHRLAAVDGQLAGPIDAVDAVTADGRHAEAPFVGLEAELGNALRHSKPCRDAAAVEVHMEHAVVEIDDLELRRGVQTKRGRAEHDLCAGAVVGGDAVAGGQRPVAFDRHPLVAATVEKPDLAVGFAETGDAARRVRRLSLRMSDRRGKQAAQHPRDEQRHDASGRSDADGTSTGRCHANGLLGSPGTHAPGSRPPHSTRRHRAVPTLARARHVLLHLGQTRAGGQGAVNRRHPDRAPGKARW